MPRRLLQRHSTTLRASMQLVVATLILAAAILGASIAQRNAADRSLAETAAAERMLIGQLDMETGLRGFLQFERDDFLEPFDLGRDVFDRELRYLRREAADDPVLSSNLERQADLSSRWQTLALDAIAEVRAGGSDTVTIAEALRRKAIMDQFRATNADLQGLVDRRRGAAGARATTLSVALVVGIGLLFGVIGFFSMIRPAARRARRSQSEQAFLVSQEEFSGALQVMGSEHELQGLLRRHLGRSIPNSDVVVLTRNASDNRLESTESLPTRSGRPGLLEDARPESCLAVRLGQEVTLGAEGSGLLECELCGKAANATCAPSLVGGQVIGSVLVVSDDPLEPEDHRRLRQSVDQAAPVLANLRTLALAETRASTDGLTGLANKRSCGETLRRMVAQTSRTMQPLSAVVLDIDHFKQVNDRFGHSIGDEALAMVAHTLAGGIRTSDFAGRYGGEEFLVLLPATEADGAVELAEKLRQAVARLEVPGLPQQLTASFGVASIPFHAGDGETLVRKADGALYAAKRAGRNRVEVAETTPQAASQGYGSVVGTSRVESPPAPA